MSSESSSIAGVALLPPTHPKTGVISILRATREVWQRARVSNDCFQEGSCRTKRMESLTQGFAIPGAKHSAFSSYDTRPRKYLYKGVRGYQGVAQSVSQTLNLGISKLTVSRRVFPDRVRWLQHLDSCDHTKKNAAVSTAVKHDQNLIRFFKKYHQ